MGASASTTPQASGSGFWTRLGRALRLEAALFEEVEHDPGAMGQAAGVVALAGLASGLGMAGEGGFVGAVVAGLGGGFVMWVVCASVIWLLGVRTFGCDSSLPELLRTLGFASAPLLLLVARAIPQEQLRLGVWLAAHGLAIAAFVIATRQALDVSTGRALWICVLAFALALILLLILGLFIGPGCLI